MCVNIFSVLACPPSFHPATSPGLFSPNTSAHPQMYAYLLKFYASCDLCTISRVCSVLKAIIILIFCKLYGVCSEIGCRGRYTSKNEVTSGVQGVRHGSSFTHQQRPYVVTSIDISNGGGRRHKAPVTSVLRRFVCLRRCPVTLWGWICLPLVGLFKINQARLLYIVYWPSQNFKPLALCLSGY